MARQAIATRVMEGPARTAAASAPSGGCGGLLAQIGATARHRLLGLAAMAGLVLASACAPTVAPPRSGAQAGPAAQEQTGQVDALGRPIAPGTAQVALLLPLSGRVAPVGQTMQQAAEMAVLDLGSQGFQMMPRDTGGTAEGAQQAARSAIQDGADLILGPLLAESARAAGAAAQGSGVNVVAFSTDASVAGGNVFVMGVLPSTQVESILDYAGRQGLGRVAVVAPSDAYGTIVADSARSVAGRTGTQIVATQSYDPSATDFSGPVQAIQGSGADAVLLPDGDLRLRQVAALVPFHGMRDMQILGTRLMEDPALALEPALRGALFAAPDPALREDFVRRYEQQFGALSPELERVATLAYDAVALAVALSRTPEGTAVAGPGAGGGAFGRGALTDPAGFAGLDGIFRFGRDGTVERGLAILEVTTDGPVVVEPSPESFAGPAS